MPAGFGLMSLHAKCETLEEAALDAVIGCHFTPALAAMTAEDFVTRYLVEALRVRHVVVGHACHFGHGGRGNAALLRSMGAIHGFDVTQLPPTLLHDGTPCSSSAIRQMLRCGDLAAAAVALGRPFAYDGRVQRGAQQARTWGIPTANLRIHDYVPLPYGVYVGYIQGVGTRGKAVLPDAQPALANIGVRPTVERGDTPYCEVHSLQWSGTEEWYGRTVRFTPVRYLRAEQRFGSIEALKAAILADKREAEAWARARSVCVET
jgi:riboflavin kinase/FMN adenylyltransferase